MKIFARKIQDTETNFDSFLEKVERSIQTRENERQIEVAEANVILNTIGQTTDRLADETLRLVDYLPEPERSDFMRSVLRKLTAQALHENKNLNLENARDFGRQVLRGYGESFWGISISGPDHLAEVIIEESLPSYTQGTLELFPAAETEVSN